MAQLTYDIWQGVLTVRPETSSGNLIVATATSGRSNLWFESSIAQKKDHGKAGHVCGGPIPPGRWPVLKPGSKHPDSKPQHEAKLRPGWIPVGPVTPGRTLIYIHPAGTRTEGCIAVHGKTTFERIYDLVLREGGGVLHVLPGINLV